MTVHDETIRFHTTMLPKIASSKVETVFHPRPIGCHKPWLYLLPSDMLLGMALFLLVAVDSMFCRQKGAGRSNVKDMKVRYCVMAPILAKSFVTFWPTHLGKMSISSICMNISMKIHPQVANPRPLGVG